MTKATRSLQNKRTQVLFPCRYFTEERCTEIERRQDSNLERRTVLEAIQREEIQQRLYIRGDAIEEVNDVEVNASQLSCSARRIRRRLVSTKSFSRRKCFAWFYVLLLDDQQLVLESRILSDVVWISCCDVVSVSWNAAFWNFVYDQQQESLLFVDSNQQMVERPVDGSSADLRYATSFGLVAATPFWVVLEGVRYRCCWRQQISAEAGFIFKDLVFVVDYQFPYLEYFSNFSFSVFSTLVTVHRELLRLLPESSGLPFSVIVLSLRYGFELVLRRGYGLEELLRGRAVIPHSYLPAGIVATMRRVVNYHSAWAGAMFP
ncbi:hypothetical protein F511_25969 [Dorcoceras hygrometricum]|uniref:Uncharacterized protein n=1 Tax=Dorcoceras hygrometricum TaxID=472368 RepID=A0A2Z7ANQ8_9LAMI|nr:hypothetical protein F511_25969 [Dorcoceras hygrometricum]